VGKNRRRGSKLEDLTAKNYQKAGYSVEKHVITNRGEIDIIAKWRHKTYAIEVKSGKQIITSTDIEKIYKKAKHVKAKPVLRHSPRTKITQPAIKLAKLLNVSIKPIKIGKKQRKRKKTRKGKRKRK